MQGCWITSSLRSLCVLKSGFTPFLCSYLLLPLSVYTSVCKHASQRDKSTYSENSPQIQAAAYSTSQMPFRCMLPVNRWALSSRVAIWATAKTRMALTRIATSSICEAMRWPCRVPSNRVSSTRILMYLSSRYEDKVKKKTWSEVQHDTSVESERLTIRSWWCTGSCSGCRCRWSWWAVHLCRWFLRLCPHAASASLQSPSSSFWIPGRAVQQRSNSNVWM